MAKLRIIDNRSNVRELKKRRKKPWLASTKWKILSLILYSIVMVETTYIIHKYYDLSQYVKIIKDYVWQIKDLF